MSKEVENKVVEMDFDNSKFLSGVESTIRSLGALTQALTATDGETTFDNMESGITSAQAAIQSLGERFDTWGIIAMTAVSNVTDKIVDGLIGGINKVKNLIDDLTFSNISSGFDAYEEELKNVNTIVRATEKPIEEVEEALDKIRWYTDETSYSYGAMVEAVQKFTSQGIDLNDAVTYIQGFGNMAGLAGSEATEATHAFEGFAKAIQQGTMSRQIWGSWIQTAQLSNVNTKKIFLEAAEAAGTLKKKSEDVWVTNVAGVKETEVTIASFEDSLTTTDWMTKQVMSNAANKMSEFSTLIYHMQEAWDMDEVSDVIERFNHITDSESNDFKTFEAVLKSTTGTVYSTEEAFAKLQETQNSASAKGFMDAQSYRTFADAIGTVKTAVTSVSAHIFKTIIGNAEEAKALWSRFGGWMWDVFASPFYAFDELLEDFSGREDILEGLAAVGRTISVILEKIVESVKNVFGVLEVADLDNFAKSFREFTESMEESVGDGYNFGVVLETILRIFKNIGDTLKSIWDVTEPLRSSIGRLIESISYLIFQIIYAISETGSWNAEGSFLETVIERLSTGIDWLATKIRELNLDKIYEKVSGFFDKISGGLKPIIDMFKNLFITITSINWEEIFAKIKGWLEPVKNIAYVIKNVLDKIWDTITKLFENIKTFFTKENGGFDWSKAGVFLSLFKIIQFLWNNEYIADWFDALKNGLRGIMDAITEIAETFYSIEMNNYADALLKFAIALGILTLILIVLASVNWNELAKGLTFLGVLWLMASSLLETLNAFAEKASMVDVAKIIALGTSLLLISGAILVLSVSLLILVGVLALFQLVATKNDGAWEGLGLMALVLLTLVGVLFLLAKTGPMIIVGAVALTIMSGALLILAAAIAAFALIGSKMTGLGNGIAAFVISLGSIIIALKLLSKIDPGRLIAAAGALIIVSVAILAISVALAVLTGLALISDGGALAGGVVALVVSLAALTGVLVLLGKAGPIVLAGAAALLIAGAACIFIAAGLILAVAAFGLFLLELQLVEPALSAVGSGIGKLVGNIFEEIGRGISNGIKYIADAITDIGDSIGNIGDNVTKLSGALISLNQVPWFKLSAGLIEVAIGFSDLIKKTKDLYGTATNTSALADALTSIATYGSVANSQLKALVGSFTNLGTVSIEGFTISISNGFNAAIKVVSTGCSEMINAIKKVSNSFKTQGTIIVTTFAAGITFAAAYAVTAASNMVIRAYNSAVGANTGWYKLGNNAAIGYANGIFAYASSVARQAYNMVYNAKQAAARAQESKSPSKVFARLGSYAGQGYALGIESETNNVSNSVTKMINAAVSRIDAGFDADDTPVIRPVIDTSGVRQGLDAVSGMLNDNSTYTIGTSVASAFGINQNGGDSSVKQSVTLDEASIKALKNQKVEVNSVVNFEGNLAQLGAVLQPVIKSEETRRGPSLVNSAR